LFSMDNANLIHSVILDSAITVTTQTSRSSRSSRSKRPSKSTILRNKQKEKEELDNQLKVITI
ncbi:9323_t:CDS:1, partial [Funneliformis caledonium]